VGVGLVVVGYVGGVFDVLLVGDEL